MIGIDYVFHVCYLIYSFDRGPKRWHLYVLVKCLASWGWEVVWALAVPVAAWYLESILLKRRLAELSCVKNHRPIFAFLAPPNWRMMRLCWQALSCNLLWITVILFLKVSLGEQSGGASSEPLDEAVQGFIKICVTNWTLFIFLLVFLT